MKKWIIIAKMIVDLGIYIYDKIKERKDKIVKTLRKGL